MFSVILLLLIDIFESALSQDLPPLTLSFVQNAASRKAVCNDGTPAGYYLRKAPQMGGMPNQINPYLNNWIIWLEGGKINHIFVFFFVCIIFFVCICLFVCLVFLFRSFKRRLLL